MARSTRIPSYRRHSSGQARVTITGKDHLLGPHGSAASKEAYRRLVAEFLANPTAPTHTEDRSLLSINALVLAYWRFAKRYYGFNANSRSGDMYALRAAIRLLRSLYGRTAAQDFGPMALKACREEMIRLDWSRNYINAQIDRVRRAFRWAAEEELLPGRIYENLRAVPSLRRGRSEARETKRIRPVPQEFVDAASPYMPAMVADMVRIQQLCGCRPDEICKLRPNDLDKSDPQCWIYRPGSDQGGHGEHKTAHHDHDRLIFLGPRAQAILRYYLNVGPLAYCFCPAQSERTRNAKRRVERRSPMTPSQAVRQPKTDPKRSPSERYDTNSYRRAIVRACKKADRARHEADRSIPADQVIVPTWSPNRLRHNRGTEIRSRHGLDLAKTILGHTKIETTQLYAERDIEAAKRLIAEIG